MATLLVQQKELLEEIRQLNLIIILPSLRAQMMALQLQPFLVKKTKEAQKDNYKLKIFRRQIEAGQRTSLSINVNGSLQFGNQSCVPKEEVRQKILLKAHYSSYSIHPYETKIYQDLKQYFKWHGMKQDIAIFVLKHLACKQVKAEHQIEPRLLLLTHT